MNNKIDAETNPLIAKNIKFLNRKQKLMINNEWVEPSSGKTDVECAFEYFTSR